MHLSINYWDGQYVLLQRKRWWIFTWWTQIDVSGNLSDVEAVYQKMMDEHNLKTNNNGNK